MAATTRRGVIDAVRTCAAVAQSGGDGAARATRRGCAAISGPRLQRGRRKLPFAEDLLAAYYCAFDRATPLQVKAALVGALAYFVLPFDGVPDVLPLLGYSDDAAVLLTALGVVADHMRPEHREAAQREIARLKARPASALRPHHQLAHRLALGERLDRLRRLRQRIDLAGRGRRACPRRTIGRARSSAAR